MSLGWIKITTDLRNKPEVISLARTLEIPKDRVVGVLLRFWFWADGVTVDGVVDGVVSRDVDDVVDTPGFARSLESVGWLQIDDEKARIRIPNFDRHNGESAKKRALKNARQAKWRHKTVDATVDGHVDAPASTKASTREEKRRSKNKATPPPNGGSTVWDFGKSLLAEQGLSQQAAGSLIGSWLRDWTEPQVADALRSAAGKADVKSYVIAVLRTKAKKGEEIEPEVAMP